MFCACVSAKGSFAVGTNEFFAKQARLWLSAALCTLFGGRIDFLHLFPLLTAHKGFMVVLVPYPFAFGLVYHFLAFVGERACVILNKRTCVNLIGQNIFYGSVHPQFAVFVLTLPVPNKAIATATANSKKFDAPIIPAGAAISCDSFKSLEAK